MTDHDPYYDLDECYWHRDDDYDHFQIDLEEDEKAELAVLKRKMEDAHSLFVRAQERNLRDANLRQIDYHDAKELYDAQKKFVDSFKKNKTKL